MKFYAVKKGRNPGVYSSWDDCKVQVDGYSGAIYKSFKTEEEAIAFVGSDAPATQKHTSTTHTGVTVYTDGSYDIKTNRYSWAYVIIKDNQLVFEDAGVGTHPDAASMRNVAGELAAAMRGIKTASELYHGESIELLHDYIGVASWVDRSWKAKNEMTKAYVDYMDRYKGNLSFQHVRGHSGCYWNEYVDRKARDALGI